MWHVPIMILFHHYMSDSSYLCCLDGYLKEITAALWLFNWRVGNPFCLSLSTSAPEQEEYDCWNSKALNIRQNLRNTDGTILETQIALTSSAHIHSSKTSLLLLSSPSCCDGCTARDVPASRTCGRCFFLLRIIRKATPLLEIKRNLQTKEIRWWWPCVLEIWASQLHRTYSESGAKALGLGTHHWVTRRRCLFEKSVSITDSHILSRSLIHWFWLKLPMGDTIQVSCIFIFISQP